MYFETNVLFKIADYGTFRFKKEKGLLGQEETYCLFRYTVLWYKFLRDFLMRITALKGLCCISSFLKNILVLFTSGYLPCAVYEKRTYKILLLNMNIKYLKNLPLGRKSKVGVLNKFLIRTERIAVLNK